VSSERPARALVVTRLSRVTDATTSPERQLAICRELIAERGYDEIGVVEDLDVSGSVDPFDRKRRPELAGWLRERGDEFDVLIAYRVDRLTRSIRHLQELVHWADDHGKLIVSATEQHFDMTTPFAHVVIALMGTVAQMELEAISERNRNRKQDDLRKGNYKGGTPPWGYVPKRVDGVWRLAYDRDQADVINEVARRVIGGESLNSISHDLTRRGIKSPKGNDWNVTPLKRSLMSEAMLGRVTDRSGKSIRGDDGSPIQRAEPVLDRDVWGQVREVLDSRSRGSRPQSQGSLLTRVIFCGMPSCGKPAYRFNGGSHSQFPRYRCQTATKAHKCGNRTIRADDLCELIEAAVPRLLGDSERLERVWEHGSDNSDELAELDELLADLTDQLGTGQFKRGTPQRQRLDERLRLLADKRDQLASQPSKPSGWHWVSTGELFGPWWASQDVGSRNAWLRSAGVRVEFDRDQVRIDLGDLGTMLRELQAGPTATQWSDMFATLGPGQGVVVREHDGVFHAEVVTDPRAQAETSE
jgi:site-specific DNA recombinase